MLTYFLPLKCQSSYIKMKYIHIALLPPCKVLLQQFCTCLESPRAGGPLCECSPWDVGRWEELLGTNDVLTWDSSILCVLPHPGFILPRCLWNVCRYHEWNRASWAGLSMKTASWPKQRLKQSFPECVPAAGVVFHYSKSHFSNWSHPSTRQCSINPQWGVSWHVTELGTAGISHCFKGRVQLGCMGAVLCSGSLQTAIPALWPHSQPQPVVQGICSDELFLNIFIELTRNMDSNYLPQ